MGARRALSVENLESRLNLSSLGGLALPMSIDVPIRAEERMTVGHRQALSVADLVRYGSKEQVSPIISGAPGGKGTSTSASLVAPGNLTAAATSTSVALKWADTNGNESGFRVYRSTDGVNFAQVGQVGKNKVGFSDTTVKANTAYHYYVVAYTSSAVSPASSKVSVTTPIQVTAPGNPANLSIAGTTETSVTLGWSDTADNETGYRVYRSTDGSNFALAASLGADASAFTDTALSPATTYTYKVAAWNSAGESFAASPVTGTTLMPPAPEPVVPTTDPVSYSTKWLTSLSELRIDGTSGNDSILVTQSNGVLTITANGQVSTLANTFGDLMITTGAGDDVITIDSSVNISTRIYAGDGNNVVRNGTTGKATIVTIGNGVNTVYGNGINTAYWVNPGDAVVATALESSLGGVNRVGTFYQPWSSTPGTADYISRDLYGQNLKDPTDIGTSRRLTASSFFGTGPSMNDINQGSLADCYFLAPLSSMAYSESARLTNMAVDLGDGTYGFRFTRGGVTSFVRVDGDLKSGSWRGGLAYSYLGSSGNQWVPLFEKAYAFYRSGANTFSSLGWGYQNAVMSDLGLANGSISASSSAPTIEAKINDSIANNKMLAANTNGSVSGAPVVASHVYSVLGSYRDASGTLMIKLRNPWGTDGAGNDGVNDGIVTLTYAQFAANFNVLSYSLT